MQVLAARWQTSLGHRVLITVENVQKLASHVWEIVDVVQSAELQLGAERLAHCALVMLQRGTKSAAIVLGPEAASWAQICPSLRTSAVAATNTTPSKMEAASNKQDSASKADDALASSTDTTQVKARAAKTSMVSAHTQLGKKRRRSRTVK